MLRENPNPGVTDVPKFMAKIKQLESLENAVEYTRNVKQIKPVLSVTQKVPEEKDVVNRQEDRPHYLCGKVHRKGQCTFECTGCGMKGSHKPDKCFVHYPNLRCQGRGSDRQGYRHRDRSKSKSGEGSKHRGSSPYPNDRRSAKRVAEKQLEKHDDIDTDIETDRDSDTLEELRDIVKNHEKLYKRNGEI